MAEAPQIFPLGSAANADIEPSKYPLDLWLSIGIRERKRCVTVAHDLARSIDCTEKLVSSVGCTPSALLAGTVFGFAASTAPLLEQSDKVTEIR